MARRRIQWVAVGAAALLSVALDVESFDRNEERFDVRLGGPDSVSLGDRCRQLNHSHRGRDLEGGDL